MKSILSILLIALSSLVPASANDLQLVISGRAYHQGSGSDLNEDNFGIGLQYDFATHRRWVPLINMASLKDSNDNQMFAIGL